VAYIQQNIIQINTSSFYQQSRLMKQCSSNNKFPNKIIMTNWKSERNFHDSCYGPVHIWYMDKCEMSRSLKFPFLW